MNPFADFGISFANPWLLLLLLAIPVLAFLRGDLGGAPTVLFSSTGPLRSLGRRVQSRAGNFLTTLLSLALALLIIAMARPQHGKSFSQVEASGIDVMLVLDVSGSMIAEDYEVGGKRASRIAVVKKSAEKFIEDRPNDRIGIIAFGSVPYLVSPLTLDHDWLQKNMDRVQIGLVEDATAIGSGIASASNRLLGDKTAKSRVIVLLTDGENNSGKVSPLTAAEAAHALGIKIYTIGAGTDGNAPVPVGKNMFGQTQYQLMRFPIDIEALKQIAKIGNGQFFRATDTATLESVYKQIDQLEKTTVQLKQYQQYNDLYPWFLGAGVAVLLIQTALGQTLWRRLP
jgi:Ca-activated chloride channel family protein